jgi:5-methyltetrahydrofolate--homocysteine methyltransferase
MSEAKPDATIVVKGNCGIPEFRGEKIYYSGTPPLMAEYAHLAIDAGAKIIGGCCGTSCEHLAAIRKAVDAHVAGSRPTLDVIVEKIGPLRNKTAEDAAPPRERRGRSRG